MTIYAKFLRCIAATSLAIGVFTHAGAATLDPLIDYSISASPLGNALQEWAMQSRAQIIYAPELVAERTSPRILGKHRASEALTALLRDSGIEAETTGASSWILKRAKARAPAEQPLVAPVATIETEMPTRPLAAISVFSRPLLQMAAQSSMPVTTLTRHDIESSGYLSLFDLLRAQPGIQVTSQPELMGGTSGSVFATGATGAASVALRSLGAKATLLLVDGRRMTHYGLAADATGSVADIGTIPLAMVDRIDILREGASTLYGADAMAGVIDISLRKDFDGGEVGFTLGTSGHGDATHQQLSASAGKRFKNGTSSMLTFDVLERDPLLGNQRDWYSLDRRRDGLRDERSVFSFPGNIVTDTNERIARAGCAIEDLDSSGACLDDRAKATSLSVGRNSASVRSYTHIPVTEHIEAYADLRLTETKQTQQSGPTRATILVPNTPPSTGSQLVDYAFWDVGPVQQSTRSLLSRIDIGMVGTNVGWDWTIGVDTERSRVDDDINGLVNRLGFEQAARNRGYRFDQRPAPPEIIELLAPEVNNDGRSQSAGVRATGSHEFNFWAKEPMRVSIGVERRRESVDLEPDSALVSDELLIARSAIPFSAARWSESAYAHIDLPLVSSISADLGLRFEHVETHGSAIAPAFGLRWTPTSSLLFRAGTAKGRRVPTLLEQRGLDSSGFSSSYEYVDVPAELLPCALNTASEPTRCLLELRAGPGPRLRAEHSRSLHGGMIWQPTPSLSMGFDLYQLRRNDEIGLIPVRYGLQNAGLFPDFIHRNGEGRLDALNIYRVNLGRTTVRGIDADLQWSLPASDFGIFSLILSFNHVTELSIQSSPGASTFDRAGFSGQPKWTASSSIRWLHEDWTATLGTRYTGNYAYAAYQGDTLTCPDYKAVMGKCSTPSFALFNLNMAYGGFAPWKLAFNISNLLDHTPRYFQESAAGYNPLFDDAIGRYFSIGVTRSF